jgi:hypothetical protein
MSTHIPSHLFVQFINQGVKKGLIQDVTRTLDGEYYLDPDYLKDSVASQVETHGRILKKLERFFFLSKHINFFFLAGKINVEKLANILGIEQFHVEKAIEDLLENNDWTVMDDLVLTQ